MADQQRKVSLVFDANTSGAQSKVDALAKSINKVMEMSSRSTGVASLDKDLQKSAQAAAQLRVQLTNAFNTKTGSLDLTKFNESLKSSGMSLDKYQQTFSKLGPAGEQAFNNLARSIATAEVPLRRSNTLLNDFALTLKNTIKWQLSSSIMHGFLTSVQSAMSYAQHLNQNLTDIRIVTGQSADEMARFAEQANRSARELSTTTNQYAQAALIFYQQGLNDKAVKERTDTVIKMANVTGEAAKDVSSYMTAIWNNFDDGSKSLEYYADVITKLGAATAASSKEIAGGLEKFAAIGDTIGLSYEYATAMLTTIIDKTRQSEDIVGTALKTILARIQGLNLGETLDDGTTLNKYSSALAAVGVQIKDTSGELRSMDAILNDLGAKWQTLGKDTQVALAQVVGGVRQYNQIISLMDNWDAFEMNVDIALGSEGELQEQADIYADSWKAAQKEVQAALESIYSKLIDENFFIGFQHALADILTAVGNLIDGLGGVGGVLATLGSIVFRVFNTQISNSIDNSIKSIKMLTRAGRQEVESLKREAQNKIIESASKNKNDTVKNAYTSEAQMQLKVLANAEKMNAEEQQLVQILMQQHQARVDATVDAGNELQKAEQRVKYEEELLTVRKQLAESALNAAGKDAIDVDNSINKINQMRSSVNDLTNFSDQALSVLSNTSMTTEEKLQTINNLMQQTSQTSGTWSESAKQAFGDLQSALQAPGATIESTKQSFIGFMETLGRLEVELSDTEAKFIEEINVLKENTNLTDSQKMALDRLLSSYIAVARATENSNVAKKNAKQATDDLRVSEENLGRVLDGLSKKPMTAGQQIMAFASTLMNITTLIKNVQGLLDVLGDKEMSFGEKLLTVVSIMASMGMTIAMLITNMEKLAATTVYASIKSAVLTTVKAFETGGWIAASAAIRAYISSLLAAIGPVGWIILAIAGITAAVVALTNALQNQESEVDKAQKNLKRIADENKKLAKAIKDSTKEIEEMYSTFDEYEDAYEALEKLTEGTDSWGTALANVKQLTQQLIEAYPILADMIANPEKYGTTLSNIFDENGNIKPEILEEVEERTVRRENLELFGNAAQSDEKAVEAATSAYTVYRGGIEDVKTEFNVAGSWGAGKHLDNGDVVSTGLRGSITNGTFENILPLMTEYYASLSSEERMGLESNSDFFNGSTLLEALKLSDYYYDKEAETYTTEGYDLLAGFLNSGYMGYYDDYGYGDRRADLSGVLGLYDLWNESGAIMGADLQGMDPEELKRIMLQSDTYGLHEAWYEGERVAPQNRDILNSLDSVVGGERLEYVSAVTDTQSEISGLGTGVLTELGLRDEQGNRRSASSFSNVDSIAGMAIDKAVDEWVQNTENKLPEPEEIAKAFSLTSSESLTKDEDGNYILTTLNESGEEESTTYTADQMRRMYAYQQVADQWAADESITDVGSWFSKATGITDPAAIEAINRYDTQGIEGLTLEDLRALNSETVSPYLAETFGAGELTQKIGVMELAESQGISGYDWGTINSLYGEAEEDVYGPLRDSIAAINAERANLGQNALTEEEINAVTTAINSGDMEKAISLMREYGGETNAVTESINALEDTAYNGYNALSKYGNLAPNFDEITEAVRELNEEGGEIDQETYDMLSSAGLDMSNVRQTGSNKYAGSISWDSYLSDYYDTKEALGILDSNGALTDEQKELFGYSGKGTQSNLTWEQYINTDEGIAAITSARGGVEAIPEDWIVNELSRFGFEYYDKLTEEGANITDEAISLMASSQAEIDGIEIPAGTTFANKAEYEAFVEGLKIDEAVTGFINGYADNVSSGLMKTLAGDTTRLASEDAQLDAFRQQLADMLGMSVEDITDEFIQTNWDTIVKLGSNNEADVQAAMIALNPQIDATRKNYADSLVRGLGEDTKAIANQALVTAAEAFKSGDYSDLTTTQLGAAQSQFYTESGTLNTEEIDLALIEAGILDENRHLTAEGAKYGTIEDAREAFVDGVTTYYGNLADAATENLTDNLEDSLEDVTARILSNVGGFAGTFKEEDVKNVRSAVAGAQKYGGRNASQQLESIFGQAGDKASLLAAEFASIDWDNVSVDELESIVYDLGLSSEITTSELEALVAAMDEAIQFTNSLTQALNNYASDTELADKLRNGEDISAEEYARAESIFGKEQAQQMFALNANGTYGLTEGYDGNAIAEQIEASIVTGFANAALQWQDVNAMLGTNGTALASQDAFLEAQTSEQGIAATDNALGYIYENLATLFPEVDSETANQAISTFQNSDRQGEDILPLLKAFGVSDLSELFNANVQQGLGRQAEEAGEAASDAEESIPRENKYAEMMEDGFSEEDIENRRKALEEMDKTLRNNEDALLDLTKASLKYDRACEQVNEHGEDWLKIAKKQNRTAEEQEELTINCRKAMADMLGLDTEDLAEGIEENEEAIKLMGEAAEGSEEALNDLQALNVKMDFEVLNGEEELSAEVEQAIDNLADNVYNLEPYVAINPNSDISGMENLSADVGRVMGEIQAQLDAGAINADQAATALSNALLKLGYDAEITTIKQGTTESIQYPVWTSAGTVTQVNPDGSSVEVTNLSGTTETLNLETDREILAVKSITPTGSAGGHVTTGGGGGGGGGGGRPRRGGGGRRGGGRGREAPRAEKKKDSEKERYHSITNVLEDLTDAFDKVSKASDRAFGKARIKLLEQQEEALQDLLSAQGTYLEEIEANLEADMDLLESMDFGVELQFDENGTLLNFEDLQNAMWDEYNSHIDENGNVIGMTDEEWKKYEEDWKERMEALAQYEETQDLWKEAKQQLQDYINQIHDIRLEQVTYAVEIDIEASENSLELLDYLLNKIGDSAWDAADAIANMGEQAQEYLGDLVTNEDGSTSFIGGQINTIQGGIAGILGNHTRDIVDEKTGKVLQSASLTDADVQGFMNGDAAAIEKVRQMGLNGTLTDAEVQALKDYHNQLLQANQALMDLRDSVHEKVLEAFQQFNEELQEGIDKIDHLGRMMQSYRNIVDIVGKENLGVSNTMLEAIGQGQVENKIDSLGGQKARVDSLKAMIADAEAKAASATTKEDKDKWKENIEEMKKELADAEEDFMGSWEEALQSIQEQFELAVSNTIETFSDALAGPLAGSLDELQASFDRQNNLAERFLPEYEKIYELNKLNRDITNSINDTDNVKAKQELAKLQEEINALEAEGTEVSRFQTEDLRRRYELKLAELALEEAKNAKSNVQMARNADGDWSYVYTADEEDVAAAEQTYEDRMFAIQQANAEYINEMQNSLIQAQADMASEIEAIMTDETLSMEEKMQKVNEIKEYYTEMFGFYSDELQYVMDQNGTAFESTTLSALTGFQNLEDYNENFYAATTAMMTDLDEAYAMWKENTDAAMEAAGTSIDGFADHLSEQTQAMVDDSNEARESVENLGQAAVDAFGDITEAVENWVTQYGEKISEILTKNEALATSFRNLLNEWSNFDNKDNQNPAPTEPEPTEPGGDDGGGDENDEPEYMGQITIKKGYQYWGYKSPKGGSKNKVKVVNDDRQERTYKFTQMDTSTSRKRVYIPSEKVWVSSYDPDGPKRIKVEKFDTGGYTGSWGSEGRMAMLHEKEIVLNKADTANLLTAVDMIRQVAKIIDLNAYSSAGFGSSIMGMASGSAGQFEQNVHITAEFPNATDRNEIYAAFTDIVNLASQYANR